MKLCKRTALFMVVLGLAFCPLCPSPSYAAEDSAEEKAVVFLLDASGSMKTNDPQRYAIDSIAQLVYTLPTNYDIGLVAYNTDICVNQPPLDDTQREQLMALAQGVRYVNYSNAGAGLTQAVNLLASSQAAEKDVVMLSDGEILMKDDTATGQSFAAYQAAIETAAQAGISIHVIGLGKDMENTENSIFQAASRTDGGIYYTPQALGIQAAMDSILEEQFGIKQMTAAIVDADGGLETVPVESPFSYANVVRVLLTSDAPIKNVKTNFNADSASQVTGERYSLIAIDKPQGSGMEVSFMGTAGHQVRITLIPEYYVIPKVQVTYEDREPLEEAARYDREATLEYTFYDAENEHIQLWTEAYFNHGKISVLTDGQSEEYALENGTITYSQMVTGNTTEQVAFDCTSFPANVLMIHPLDVELEEAPLLPIPEPEPEPPYLLYGVLAVAVVGIILVIVRRPGAKKTEEPPEDDGRPAPGKSSYVGKLNIYITRTPSGYDIEPLSYNLFRLPSTKVISIAEVLESCGVKEVFSGADKIYLNSGQGRSLILTNQSDCCLMKSGEILMKKKSYQIFENSKVDITFEDEVSELTFQYKVLKPSEMV